MIGNIPEGSGAADAAGATGAETPSETLRRCPLFDGIDDADLKPAVDFLSAHVRHVDEDASIVAYRQPIDEMMYVQHGTVRLEIFDAWGRRTLVGMRSNGFLTGAIAVFRENTETFFSVVASTPCTVTVLDRRKVLGLIAGPTVPQGLEHAARSLCFNIARLTSLNLVGALHRVNFLAQRTVRDRVALFLTSRSEHAGSRKFRIGMSRQQLADYLSIDRSTLCEELSKMQREGLIRYHLNDFELL